MQSTESTPIPRLRYRRFFGGYRRDEVLYHLRELEASVRNLEARLAASRERAELVTTHLDAANGELARMRVREAEVEQELVRGRRQAEDMVAAAERQAAVILAEASERAARIKTDAHLQIEEIGRQLEEILRLRETMTTSLRGVVSDVGLALGRVERGEPMFGPRREPQRLGEPSTAADSVSSTMAAMGDPAQGELFERRLEVHAGPFADFATLSRFEGALASLPLIEDVYVREFDGEWAVIEVSMQREQRLVGLLAGALSDPFEAERTADGALRLTLRTSSVANAG